jgi:glutamate racemase
MKDSKAIVTIVLLLSALLFNHCSSENAEATRDLGQSILSDTSNFYYIDTKNYPLKNKKLPVGIFDSGTGGLTVFDAIINYDGFDNQSNSS